MANYKDELSVGEIPEEWVRNVEVKVMEWLGFDNEITRFGVTRNIHFFTRDGIEPEPRPFIENPSQFIADLEATFPAIDQRPLWASHLIITLFTHVQGFGDEPYDGVMFEDYVQPEIEILKTILKRIPVDVLECIDLRGNFTCDPACRDGFGGFVMRIYRTAIVEVNTYTALEHIEAIARSARYLMRSRASSEDNSVRQSLDKHLGCLIDNWKQLPAAVE